MFARAIKLGFVIGLTISMSSCTIVGGPPVGHMFNQKTSFKSVDKWKSGKDCATRILFFGPFGTKSLRKAAINGKIKNLMYTEIDHKEYLVFGKTCRFAYGL